MSGASFFGHTSHEIVRGLGSRDWVLGFTLTNLTTLNPEP